MQGATLKFGAATLLAVVTAGPLFAQAPTGPGRSTAPTVTSTGTNSSTGNAKPGATGTAGTSSDMTGTAVTPENKPGATAQNAPAGTTSGNAQQQQDRYDPGADARASKVIGSTIYNDQNETVGSLDDILISRDNKQPVRAVISVGGFLGIGNKLVEVDYNRLKFDENNKVVLPNATKDDLNKMPGFTYRTASNAPNINNGTLNTAPVVPLGAPATGTPDTTGGRTTGTPAPSNAPAPTNQR